MDVSNVNLVHPYLLRYCKSIRYFAILLISSLVMRNKLTEFHLQLQSYHMIQNYDYLEFQINLFRHWTVFTLSVAFSDSMSKNPLFYTQITYLSHK